MSLSSFVNAAPSPWNPSGTVVDHKLGLVATGWFAMYGAVDISCQNLVQTSGFTTCVRQDSADRPCYAPNSSCGRMRGAIVRVRFRPSSVRMSHSTSYSSCEARRRHNQKMVHKTGHTSKMGRLSSKTSERFDRQRGTTGRGHSRQRSRCKSRSMLPGSVPDPPSPAKSRVLRYTASPDSATCSAAWRCTSTAVRACYIKQCKVQAQMQH